MVKPLVVVLALLLALTACSAPSAVSPSSHVDVDTPQLRALKAKAGIAPCPATDANAAPDGLADVSLPCLGGGRSVRTAHLRGPMVVNLFAQWCHPCRQELPYYESFAKKYAGKVAVLGVDWMDTRPGLALQLAAQTGVTYPLLADPQPQLRAVGNALPQLILLDGAGKVVYQRGIQIHSTRELERLVRKHLGVSA